MSSLGVVGRTLLILAIAGAAFLGTVAPVAADDSPSRTELQKVVDIAKSEAGRQVVLRRDGSFVVRLLWLRDVRLSPGRPARPHRRQAPHRSRLLQVVQQPDSRSREQGATRCPAT